ncbi:hypothetical protein [Fluviispira sanaruensis]|uniref:Uncharacterized protein n=1 Tax=Fluviispira sanaruensis TaxID=2493639 RepID=A0A4P2VN45_FLUSA|nr:hypothetical protein [Fluviispira sanaruensis]BBH54451.1 hypothetical protein JCM31447_29220 [Fluviispira sanaruensis]
MNLWLVIKSVKEFLEQLWCGLGRQINFKLIFLGLIQIHFATFAQLSVLDKAESFFYNKDYEKSSELYKNILKNEYSSKKDIAMAKCRIALINMDEKEQLQSQMFLEEALSENILSLPMTSICSYGLLQVYIKVKKYSLAVSLVKVLEFPNLQANYLVKYYALAAEAARFSINKEFEKIQLKKLQDLMKKNNFQTVSLDKEDTKKLTLFDVEARLSVLNFDENIASEFSNDFVANVFLTKIKDGDYSTALEILEKNIVKNSDSLTLLSGISINNSAIRNRLVHLINDNPQEMRIGIILEKSRKNQKYKQNFLRGVAAFLSSSAISGVSYEFYIVESKNDGGRLSGEAYELIFKKHIHTLLIGEGFEDLSELSKLTKLFSIPLLIPSDKKEFLVVSRDSNDLSSIKRLSEKGKFNDYFEKILQENIKNLSTESQVFDSLILIRNMQFLANGSQSAQIDKMLKDAYWKVNGIAVYENSNPIK